MERQIETRKEFQLRLQRTLDDIGKEIFSYDENEYWMYASAYETLEFYAAERRLWNTAVALPLARGLHDGEHRKSSITRKGVSYRLPYVIHPLMVARMLMDMQVPLTLEEEDLMLAAALCHDMIEDISFPKQGRELVEDYRLDERVYEIVKLLSKRRDFTAEEELAFFHRMQQDPLAVLVKLSDRSNNVEDMYNMSVRKVHEYVEETERLFFPMCDYAKENYPAQRIAFEILEDKIRCLTEAALTLADRYAEQEQELLEQLERLKTEHDRLLEEWKKLWTEK